MIRNDVILEDTTLRDGEQSPGVAFSIETKLAIFDLLVASGIRWIEAGIPIMGGSELAALRLMQERRPDSVTLVAWNRGRRSDIQFALNHDFTAIHIGLPVSDQHLKGSLGKDRRWLLTQACDLVKFVKDVGAYVSISAEDVARAELSFLQEYAGRVAEAGADRLRLSDTIGALTPEGYGERIRAVASVGRLDLMCHAHNDFGLAVANTLAGLASGARFFHATVNGIGERAGMADVAQMAFALKHLYSCDLKLDGRLLKELSDLVSTATKTQPWPWQPVFGANVFAHESGIHVKGMLTDSQSFEPISPDAVGASRRFVVGKHSGRASLRHALALCGLDPQEDLLPRCLELVREVAVTTGEPVMPAQLVGIYRSLIGNCDHGIDRSFSSAGDSVPPAAIRWPPRLLPEERRPLLRRLLAGEKPVRLIEAHNGLSAIVATQAEVACGENPRSFDGIWLSSFARNAVRGLPDIELRDSVPEAQITEILGVTTKPLLVDGDTGGDPRSFEYLCRRLECMGVSGVVIEDKECPKLNSFVQGVQRLQDPKDFAAKITSGRDALDSEDFLIIARIESFIANAGVEDALNRACCYLLAGADAIVIHSIAADPGEVFAFVDGYEELSLRLGYRRPLACIPTAYSELTAAELARRGVNLIIYANHQVRAAHKAMARTCELILSADRALEANAMCSAMRLMFDVVGLEGRTAGAIGGAADSLGAEG